MFYLTRMAIEVVLEQIDFTLFAIGTTIARKKLFGGYFEEAGLCCPVRR